MPKGTVINLRSSSYSALSCINAAILAYNLETKLDFLPETTSASIFYFSMALI